MISNLKNQSTIAEQVMSALQDDNLSDDELSISEHIIGNLDDQGYLSIDLELISDKLNISNFNLSFSSINLKQRATSIKGVKHFNCLPPAKSLIVPF